MKALISNNFSSQWPLISYKPTKILCRVNMIKKDMPLQEAPNKKYLAVLKSKWTFIICIKNSTGIKQPLNTMICTSKKLFRCMKVMDFQVSHLSMYLFIWLIHNLRNLETQQSNLFKILMVNWKLWPMASLKKSSSVSQLWSQKSWKSSSELFLKKENTPERLLSPLSIPNKTICSLTIRNTKTTDLKSLEAKPKCQEEDKEDHQAKVAHQTNANNWVEHHQIRQKVDSSMSLELELTNTSHLSWELLRIPFQKLSDISLWERVKIH